MAGKKIKLDEEAIGEILVTDTDSKSASEASDFDYFEEEEEEEDKHHHHHHCQQQQQQQQQQASAETETQAAIVVDYHPGDRLKEGTQIFIFLLVQQKVWKKVRLRTSTKTAHHCLCLCCFSQKFFICWWNRPTYTTSNT